MSFDPRCYDLAELFLSDEPAINTREKRDELAQIIQDAVEDFIAYERDPSIAFDTTQITSPECRSNPQPDGPCHTLAKGQHAPAHAESHANAGGQLAVANAYAVRRLTPRECERLQGAPDDWTLVTYRGKPMADGPRYKMIGNSWAVPCVRWIGARIADVAARRERLLSRDLASERQLPRDPLADDPANGDERAPGDSIKRGFD